MAQETPCNAQGKQGMKWSSLIIGVPGFRMLTDLWAAHARIGNARDVHGAALW